MAIAMREKAHMTYGGGVGLFLIGFSFERTRVCSTIIIVDGVGS